MKSKYIDGFLRVVFLWRLKTKTIKNEQPHNRDTRFFPFSFLGKNRFFFVEKKIKKQVFPMIFKCKIMKNLNSMSNFDFQAKTHTHNTLLYHPLTQISTGASQYEEHFNCIQHFAFVLFVRSFLWVWFLFGFFPGRFLSLFFRKKFPKFTFF